MRSGCALMRFCYSKLMEVPPIYRVGSLARPQGETTRALTQGEQTGFQHGE